ncbi:MAG: lysophospholipid acyltransferase family protein [Sulfurospirillaceae bacterium]|nr:lysophospholipid acyltransferase family protein [Sulfurospirillaceae bacterium]MDD3462238.1 lysophospholipid acyltransferase family protein [Sulfurospirillaceae bacterium]
MAKLSFKKRILLFIAPPLIYAILKLLYLTCKKEFYSQTKEPLPHPSIYALWHGELLMLPFAYIYFANSFAVNVMISRHFDGELIARLVGIFGGETIRGSSSKGSTTALKSAFSVLNEGKNLAITPDGPRGPRHSIADGIVLISQKKSIPIIALNCKPTRFWSFKSWDRFCIPKPFCTLRFYCSMPFYVNNMELEEAKLLIKQRLCENAA